MISSHKRPEKLLDPGLCLSLRPMQYPGFFDMYKSAIKNSWTVDEVDFASEQATAAASVNCADGGSSAASVLAIRVAGRERR